MKVSAAGRYTEPLLMICPSWRGMLTASLPSTDTAMLQCALSLYNRASCDEGGQPLEDPTHSAASNEERPPALVSATIHWSAAAMQVTRRRCDLAQEASGIASDTRVDKPMC